MQLKEIKFIPSACMVFDDDDVTVIEQCLTCIKWEEGDHFKRVVAGNEIALPRADIFHLIRIVGYSASCPLTAYYHEHATNLLVTLNDLLERMDREKPQPTA